MGVIYTSDEEYFGRNVWVYCNQHLRPHQTGWCSVHNRNKTKLDATTQAEAYAECEAKGLKIWSGS
jgi:hypothetical protein